MNLDILKQSGKEIVAWGIGTTFHDCMTVAPLDFACMVDTSPTVRLGRTCRSVLSPELFLKSFSARETILVVFTPSFQEIKIFLNNVGVGYYHGANLFYFLEFADYISVINGMSREREFDFLDKIIRPGDCALDVGANVGLYSQRLSVLSSPSCAGNDGGTVLAFEPVLTNFMQAEFHMSLLGLNNVFVFNCAIGGGGLTEGRIVTPLSNSGVAMTGHCYIDRDQQIKSDHFGFTEESSNHETVTFVSLDAFLPQRGLANLRFIKIDVEGFEDEVIKGSTEVLMRFRPIVQVEILPSQPQITEIIGTMRNLGYFFYHLVDRSTLLPITHCGLIPDCKNYYFFPEEVAIDF